MSFLEDLVKVTITTSTQQVSRAGFGIPLILGCSQRIDDLWRRYTSAAAMLTDGYLATDPEYLQVAAAFAQNPRPSSVIVGRRTHLPTMRWKVTPVVKNSTKYALMIGGVEYSFTSDSSALLAEILAGLETAINAATLTHGLTADDSSGTHIVLTAAQGAWQRVVPVDLNLFAIEQDNADGGIASDLGDIWLQNKEWYALLSTHNSAAEVAAAAAWIETNKRFFLAASQDSGILGSGTADIASTLKTAGYTRTSVVYHPDNGAFADAAWDGACLPLDPGSETWKFKTLAGVATVELTPNQVENAKSKNANVYITVGGTGMTDAGTVGAGEWIDIVRFIDWLSARMRERCFFTLKNARKVPYTQKGIGVIENDVRAQLEEGVTVGGLDSYTVTPPVIGDVSSADRAARKLRNMKFAGVLAGAIHELEIDGTLGY